MDSTNNTEFGIVVNDLHEYSIWPTHSTLPPGWRYAGPIGKHHQMQELLDQHFQTTRAATYLRPETRFGDSRL